MKITMPLWSLTRLRGGTERAGSELANAFARRGHEVIIFTSGLDPLPPLYPLHPSVRLEYNLIQLRSSRSGLDALRRQVCAHSPDVLLGLGSDAVLLSHAGMVHGTSTALVLSDRTAPHITGGVNWNQPDRVTAFAAAHRIHCLLPGYAASYPPCLRARIRHIPNGTPLAPFADTQATREATTPKILLAVGRLRDSIKQHSLLISAFALLHPYFPEWQLHIWGGDFYDEQKDLQKLIDSEGLHHHALLKGETCTVAEVMRTASVLCHPSRYEGFPMTVVEALRHSLPVVGFAHCEALQSIVQPDFGRLAPKMTPFSLAETLAPLMASTERRRKLGEKALAESEKYTLDTVVTQWEELLEEAVQEHRECSSARPACQNVSEDMLPPAQSWQNILRVYVSLLRQSGLFDYAWYRAQYVRGPEVMDPLEHYILFGAGKGYNPNPWFNTKEYTKHFLQKNHDNMNPLLHYYLFGKGGRLSPASHDILTNGPSL